MTRQWKLHPRTLPELFICAVSQITITLLYYDLRGRREGLDIAPAAQSWAKGSLTSDDRSTSN